VDYLFHLAAEGSGGGIDFATLSQYGVLGIFAIIMIAVIRTMYQRELKNADDARQEVKELREKLDAKQQDIEDRFIPVLVKAIDSLESSADLLVEMHAFVRDNITGNAGPTPRRRNSREEGRSDA
jgi:hypothetical protein